MRILGIETSCDETGVAIYDSKLGIIANQLYSHRKLHENYGGVVPEISSREHIKKIALLINLAFQEAKIKKKEINGVAYTIGPGLIGSLFIGATVGRSLAYSLDIPAIPINHMEAHLLTPMINNTLLKFPFLTLLVSGGHTQLVSAINFGKYSILGNTLDDAIGETIDKIAFSLNLKYPGGKKLEKLAKLGVSGKFNFPRPMIKYSNMNFSFSGLKTYVKNVIQSNFCDINMKADIALAFQDAFVEVLTKKCELALQYTDYNRLVVSGGVSCNLSLKKSLKKMVRKYKADLFFSAPELSTDNGVMIAYAGFLKLNKKIQEKSLKIKVIPKWSLEDLNQ